MRSSRIALGETENVHVCPTVEHQRQCGSKPRWIEEHWPVHRIENLMLARADLEHRYDSFGRDQRIVRSKAVVHGQVCLRHSEHARRLHALNMIRFDARSDLRGPRPSKVRTCRTKAARARAARKRADRAIRSVSPNQRRAGSGKSPEEPKERLSGLTNSSGRSSAKPSLQTPQNTLTEMMLCSHLQESQEKERHLKHSIYLSNIEATDLRHENSRLTSENAKLARQNLQLRLDSVRQQQECIIMQNLIRNTAADTARTSGNLADFMVARGV